MEGSVVMLTGSRELSLLFVKWVWKHAVPRDDHCAFHQVLQLANVARPGVPLEGSHGFRRNAVDLLPHAAAKQPHEMRDKSRNVLPALSECGQQDGEDIQTVIQITTKLPTSDHLHQIPVRSRYQPDIHLVRATSP